MALSLLAAYDDLIRCTNVLTEGSCEPEFLRFALDQEECRRRWADSVSECKRLQLELDSANRGKLDLETKLHHARRLLDMEKKKRQIAEDNCGSLEKQIGLVRELVLLDGRNKLNDETREKLAFLNNTTIHSRGSHGFLDINGQRESASHRLNTINEAMDSTGSLLSDLSYSRSEDDLDVSMTRSGRIWRKHRSSLPGEDPVAKRRRSTALNKTIELEGREMLSGERLVATTTVTVAREGPMKATARIESIPSSEQNPFLTPNVPPLREIQATAPPRTGSESAESEDSLISAPVKSNTNCTPLINRSPFLSGFNIGKDRINNRGHVFCNKTMIRPETCEPCGKKIKFGKMVVKCRDCRASCHIDCKEQLPLPCVPVNNTPNKRGNVGVISDFTPTVSPMIPALILHCINEVEQRGLSEVGLYRVPGSEKDVKALKEKFLRGRGAPNLSAVDVHVICGTIKDFLRSLREPLVTQSLWPDFIRSTETQDPVDARAKLIQVISELPQPNRDTLAYLILHLQRVSECPECKMPASNLSKVFGPTIVGYSSAEPDAMTMMMETKKQVAVVELMMSIASTYWAHFVSAEPFNNNQSTPDVRSKATPDSLSRQISNTGTYRGFTPMGSRLFMNKKIFSNPSCRT